MKLFRTDPEEAIQGARTALLQTEQLIGLLQIERGAKIEQAEGDAYVADVAKIDAEIDRLQTSVTAHHDRIAVMQRRQREREQDQRERQKAACIAEIKKALPRRQAA